MDYDYLSSNDAGVTVVDNNTIQINWCTYFSDSEYEDLEVVLLSQTYQSSPVNVRIYKPAGANKAGSGTPRNTPGS